MRANDERSGRVGSIRVYGWPGSLLPYLENNADTLICPEDEDPMTALPLEEMLQAHFVIGDWEYYHHLDGPFVAKMSDTQRQDIRNAGYLVHGKRLHDIYSGYVEDGNPNVVWYCMEESVAGREQFQAGAAALDFEDTQMRVTDEGDGTFSLYVYVGSLHCDADFIRTETGESLLFIPGSQQYHVSYSAGPFGGLKGAATSYGMNSQVGSLRSGGGKVLALDYERIVAGSADFWADWDDDEDGVPIFARHPGGINVLFVDGSVKTMDPSEIDPIASWIAKTYWDP